MLHLEIVQGLPFRFLVHVQIKGGDGVLVPFDLAGSRIHLQARPAPKSSVLLLDLSTDTYGIEFDDDPNAFSIVMTGEETAALDWDLPVAQPRARFACKVVPPTGDPFNALEGIMSLKPELVRDEQ